MPRRVDLLAGLGRRDMGPGGGSPPLSRKWLLLGFLSLLPLAWLAWPVSVEPPVEAASATASAAASALTAPAPVAGELAGVAAAAGAVESRTLEYWLREIAAGAELELVLDPGLAAGEMVASVSTADWRHKLEAYARVAGFAYRVDNGILEVGVSASRIEAQLAAAGSQRQPSQGGPSEQPPAPAPGVERVLPLGFAQADKLAVVLSGVVDKNAARLIAEPRSNSLIMRGKATELAKLEGLVSLVDKPRQGFLLEASIVELSSTARDELGVQWNVSGRVGAGLDFPSSSAGGSLAALTVATTAAGHAIEARLGALEAQGRVRIVSRPRVMILEGGRARVESVRVLRVRLPDSNSVVTGAGEGQAQANRKAVEEIRVGVSMLVKPRLLGDGRVLLDIEARSSTLGAPQPPDGIPEELSRMLSAEVVVGDGETAILGGLRREGSSSNGAGLPLLSRVPVLGALFGRREEEKKSEELLILVTPRLLS
ncbi:MAG: hypothetical protein H8E45_07355 [Proteobacteria bacterium]|nr:hypothetical protein [Pseudomonadota bacterium]